MEVRRDLMEMNSKKVGDLGGGGVGGFGLEECVGEKGLF